MTIMTRIVLIFPERNMHSNSLSKAMNNLIMPLICIALTLSSQQALSAQETAQDTDEITMINHQTRFEVKAGGITVGEMAFKIVSDRKAYTLTGTGKTKGIAKWFSSGNAKLKSQGSLENDIVNVKTHSITVTEGKKTETLAMTLENGSLTSIAMKPDKTKKHLRDKNYTISEADFLNIIDPVSTFVLPVPYEKATDPKHACNHTRRIYDGETRYDMKLSYKKKAKVKTKGYNGWVYVCRLIYAPISGHKKNNKNVKRMAKNKDMEIWIAPMHATNIFTPIHISVPTWIGRFTVEATYFGPAK